MVTAMIHECGLSFSSLYIALQSSAHASFTIAHFTQLAFLMELCTIDYAKFLFELTLRVNASVRTLAIGIFVVVSFLSYYEYLNIRNKE